jgi:hypothetical protein
MIPTELFIRGLGVIYFIAFFSLWRELFALYGNQGIVPINESVDRLKSARYSFFRVPTLFQFNSTQGMAQGLTLAGLILSVMVIFHVASPLALFALWLIYLSFIHVGAPFLNFQWDYLLVETGFYAFLFSLSPLLETPMTWVFWFLLFRLMFSSCVVKLTAYTPHWRTLRAMDYHYESQPLPNLPAYFMHQQSRFISTLSTVAVLGLEGIAPFLIFFGTEARLIAFILFVLFQWLLMLTGNFAFFNVLTLLLTLPLLFSPAADLPVWAWAIGVALSGLNLLRVLSHFVPLTECAPLFTFLGWFGLLNNYGLFANMTKERYEIVIEGSDDGEEWKAYEFFTKPQDLSRAPSQIAPLQPRVEWQLWFIPLMPWNHTGWFVRFLERILEGSPAVLSLFKINPFKGAPPRYIRALIYNYRFTDLKTLKKTGCFWDRTYMGVYTPPLERRE